MDQLLKSFLQWGLDFYYIWQFSIVGDMSCLLISLQIKVLLDVGVSFHLMCWSSGRRGRKQTFTVSLRRKSPPVLQTKHTPCSNSVSSSASSLQIQVHLMCSWIFMAINRIYLELSILSWIVYFATAVRFLVLLHFFFPTSLCFVLLL